jgi:hypothetical protein
VSKSLTSYFIAINYILKIYRLCYEVSIVGSPCNINEKCVKFNKSVENVRI